MPTYKIMGFSQIAAALDTPVTVGENLNMCSFDQVLDKRALDIMMIDIQFVGGITQWIKVAAMAEARNLPVVSHICHDFAIHLISAIPNGLIVEYLP